MSSKDNRFRNRNNGVTASATVKYAGGAATPKASFLRPADVLAYAAGDLVANSTVAAQVVPLAITAAREFADSFFVIKARLRKSTANIANAAFLIHLYASAPLLVNGDNGAVLSDKSADYLGSIAINSMRAFSDGSWGVGVSTMDGPITVELADGVRTVYGLLEARDAYIPGSSETFEVTLELQQD